MPIVLDGFDVLQQIGKHPDVFAPARTEADKHARALVVKCLKTKSVGYDAVRNIHEAIGKEPFRLLLDGLKDAEIKSIVTRLDKHHAGLKDASAAWLRGHLAELADGSSDITSPPAKTKKGKKAAAEPPRLRSKSIDAFREGGSKKGR